MIWVSRSLSWNSYYWPLYMFDEPCRPTKSKTATAKFKGDSIVQCINDSTHLLSDDAGTKCLQRVETDYSIPVQPCVIKNCYHIVGSLLALKEARHPYTSVFFHQNILYILITSNKPVIGLMKSTLLSQIISINLNLSNFQINVSTSLPIGITSSLILKAPQSPQFYLITHFSIAYYLLANGK